MKRSGRDLTAIEIARFIYEEEDDGTTEVAVDDDAEIAEARDEGVWVEAWVWVSAEAIKVGVLN